MASERTHSLSVRSPSGCSTPEAAHKTLAEGRRMAFTAIHPEHGRLDATRSDLGCGLDWSQVYRVRPRVSLTCPECGWDVHAKRSPRRARYFAHNPGRPPDCQLSNESVEHHLLKLELATVVRASGWHAELEVRAPDGSWRADVMASAPDGGRRMAWEAQLSPITLDDLRERTGRYTDAGIGVCWVSPRDEGVPWLGAVPAVRVTPPPQGVAAWTVADGIAQFDEDRGAWIRVDGTELGVFTRWVLNEQLSPHPILARYRRIYLTRGGAMARRGMIWTTARSTAAEARHEKKRQRQEAWKREQQQREEEAEERKRQEEEARRQEEERRRKIEQEAAQAEARERHRLLMIELEAERKRREAERREKEEQARQAEQERLERERQEREAAARWWAELSVEQWRELVDAVAALSLKEKSARAAPRDNQTVVEYAYGVPLYAAGRLYGVVRPYPASVPRWSFHRSTRVFVRNAREAELVIEQGVDAANVVHFDLPDYEQMHLC